MKKLTLIIFIGIIFLITNCSRPIVVNGSSFLADYIKGKILDSAILYIKKEYGFAKENEIKKLERHFNRLEKEFEYYKNQKYKCNANENKEQCINRLQQIIEEKIAQNVANFYRDYFECEDKAYKRFDDSTKIYRFTKKCTINKNPLYKYYFKKIENYVKYRR